MSLARSYPRPHLVVVLLLALVLAGPIAAPGRGAAQITEDPTKGLVQADSTLAATQPPAATRGDYLPLDDYFGRIVNRIDLEGNKGTRDVVIRREIETRVGDPLDAAIVEKDRQALKTLDIFSTIEFGVRIEGEDLVLVIAVDETSRYLPLPAISISDENGLAVGAGIYTTNLFGRNIRGNLSFLFGGLQSTEIKLRSDWLSKYRGLYKFQYNNRQRDNDVLNFFETSNEIFLKAAPNLAGPFGVGLIGSYQQIRSDTDGKTLSDDNVDNVNTVGIAIDLDSRDRQTATRRGWWNEVLIEKTGLFGGDSNFWRGILDVRFYQPVGKRHILGAFGLLTLTTGSIGTEVAPWQTFALGGSNTVRGWGLGSRVGKNQGIGTLEYRWVFRRMQPLTLPFGIEYDVGLHLAGFVDVGQAWNDADQTLKKEGITGYGVGVRLVTPVLSMLRVDVGFGQGGGIIRVHVGSFEKAEMARQRVR